MTNSAPNIHNLIGSFVNFYETRLEPYIKEHGVDSVKDLRPLLMAQILRSKTVVDSIKNREPSKLPINNLNMEAFSRFAVILGELELLQNPAYSKAHKDLEYSLANIERYSNEIDIMLRDDPDYRSQIERYSQSSPLCKEVDLQAGHVEGRGNENSTE